MQTIATFLICLMMAMPLAPAKGQAASNPQHADTMKKADTTVRLYAPEFKKPLRTNLVGQTFGRLTVLAPGGRNPKNGRSMWLCRCECGVEKCVGGRGLLVGTTRSCGCLKSDVTVARCTKHGHTSATEGESSEYMAWRNMHARCTNPNLPNYSCYGGRGITVCDQWGDFQQFIKNMGLKPSNEHTLERVGNNGNYEPGNCEWHIRHVQNRNKRTNVYLEDAHGKVMVKADWFRTIGEHTTKKALKSGHLTRTTRPILV